MFILSSCLTWRQQRGPRASPGTGRGDGAHREPLVKWAAALERGRGGANPGGAGQVSAPGGGRGGLPSCALGDGHCSWKRAGSAARVGLTWAAQVEIPLAVGGGSVPVVLSGVATAARNAHFLC